MLNRFNNPSPVITNIDKNAGILRGVAVITANREAKGQGMYIDSTMVDQVVEQGNANPIGVKARFDHPNPCQNSFGTELGRFKNFRRDGDKAIADLYLYNTAGDSPNGDLRGYVLKLASEDPQAFGTSIVFRMAEPYLPNREDWPNENPDDDNPFWMEHARVKTLTHIDVVGEPAANDGLFSSAIEMDYLNLKLSQFVNDNIRMFEPILERVVDSRVAEQLNQFKNDNMESKSLFSFLQSSKDEKELTANIETLEKELSEKDERIGALENEIAELKASTNDDQLAELNEKLGALTSEVVDLKTANQKLESELNAANEKAAALAASQNPLKGDDTDPDHKPDDAAELSAKGKALLGVMSEIKPSELRAHKRRRQTTES